MSRRGKVLKLKIILEFILSCKTGSFDVEILMEIFMVFLTPFTIYFTRVQNEFMSP